MASPAGGSGLKIKTLFLALAVASCGLPRDVERTSERVAAQHVVRVGLDGASDSAAMRFLNELQRVTRARAQVERGSLEHLVERLNTGQIDLVVAPMRGDALLAEEIAFSPALAGKGAEDRPVAWRAAVRNGENCWLMTVEQAARRAGGE